MLKHTAFFLLMATTAIAESDVYLQVNHPGRNDVDRHRRIVAETTSDERDIMMVLSCRSDDFTMGGVIDFGGAASDWSIDGEDLSISYDDQIAQTFRFASSDEFLVIGGREARTAFAGIFSADIIKFEVVDSATAAFDISADKEKVGRFMELCEY